eukprot:121597_1
MSSRSDFRNRSRHPAYDGIRPSCVSFRRTKVLSRPPRGYDGPIMRIRSRGHDHSRIPMKPIRRRSRENRGPWNREKSSRPSDSLESLVFSVPLAIADSLITGDQGQTVRSVEARFGCTLEVSVPDFRTATCQLTVRGRKPGVCGRVRDFVRGIEVRNNSFDHKPVQPNESLTIQIDSSEVEVHPPRYGLHNIFSISPLSRSESVSRRVTRKPDTSQVRAARKPDTSQVRTSRKSDISQVRAARKSDTSQVRAARKPDTSQVSAARKPDTSQVRTARKPDTSKVRDGRKPDTSQVRVARKPDTSQVRTSRKSDISQVRDGRKSDTSQVRVARKPDTRQGRAARKPD